MNYKNKSFLTKKRAFTLIELLIVIAIIGILFIVLVSKVDFATDKAKATGVQTDFRSFQLAFDTVAKENAGFNTFGWDTGDANQDGIRNSYDEGDNGAGGGIAQNGIQDGTEVFTGHKVYSETFTKVYSLKKNGTGSYDRDALNRLETAINANLDPKLHVTIKDDGEIVMANGAQDPWNKEYHGWYITNAEVDKQDRGAIVMYSDGANNEFGSEHTIASGIVSISIPGNNKNGKDDYAVVSCYTYLNGYGEIKNMTRGFSNNQFFTNSTTNKEEHLDDSDVPNIPENIPDYSKSGVYNSKNEFLMSWADFQTKYSIDVSKSYSSDNYKTSISAPYYIFNNYEELKDVSVIVLDDTCRWIGSYAFAECTNLTKVILGPNTQSASDYAFYKCSNLQSIELSNKFAYCNNYAFAYCTSLTSIHLPKSVTNIGDYAFYGCDNLKNLYLDDIATWCNITFSSRDNPIYLFDNLYINDVLTRDLVLPESVTAIKTYAFYRSKCIDSIVLPNSVISIANNAFESSTINKISMTNNVTAISSYAFKGCTNLEEITLSNNITKINNYTFDGCIALSKIIGGSGVVQIGEFAFNDCKVLTNFDLSNVTKIQRSAFDNCQSLINVTFSNALTDIESSAFSSCISLTEIYIPDSTVNIGYGAFRYSGIQKVVIGNGLTVINSMVFAECNNLTEVSLGINVQTISTDAFYQCNKLQQVSMTNAVRTIGRSAFYNCYALKTIYFDGTEEEWRSINKETNWSFNVSNLNIIYT